jgi:hypothetical protein
MFTTIAYAQSILTSGTVQPIDAVPDTHVTVKDKFIYIPDLNQVVGYGGALSDRVSESYFRAPSLRRIVNLYIGEQNNSQVGAKVGQHYFPEAPVGLVKNEGLELLSDGGGDGTTAQYVIGYVLLSDGPITPVVAESFTIKATASISTTAGEWSNGPITFAQTLPVGRYQVIGARCESPTGVAFRFVPVGEFYRPGGVCVTGDGIDAPEIQRRGGLGVWFEFDSVTPPTLDILTSGTDSSQVLYLDIVKL